MTDEPTPAAPRRAWTRRLGVLAATAALALVGLELFVGRYLPVLGQVYALDAELLHDARPDARRIQPMHAGRLREGDVARVLVTTGAEGFRGRSLAWPKTVPRLLVLGDSFVMAENVPFDRTFAEQLARALEDDLPDVDSIEAVNAGRSGYGPDQSLLLARRHVDDVDPDVILFVLCAHNDLGDLARNKLFRLEEGGGLVAGRPRVGARIQEEFARRERRAGGLALERLWRFWRDSASRRPVDDLPIETVDLYLRALDAQFAEHFVHRNDEVVSLFEDVYDADVAVRPESRSVETKAAVLTGVLGEVVGLASERGVPLHFVVVPSAVDVHPSFGIRVDPVRHPEYEPGRLVDVHLAAVEVAGGAGTDLTTALSSADGRHWVGGTDIHWNATGQRAAARAVAGALGGRDEVRAALGSR